MKQTLHRCARALLLLLGGMIYVAFFSELFVRIVAPQPIMPRNIQATAAGVRGNIPGATYHHSTPETNVEFHINSVGMRDTREFPIEKESGLCRIEMFGDSFFMGYELNYPDTIAAQIEARVKQAGYNVEVLNFAVSGFGTAESLRSFEYNGARYAPDFVIFEWHSSDFADNTRSDLFELANGTLKPLHDTYLPAADAQEKIFNNKVARYIAANSHIYALLREKLSNIISHGLMNKVSISQAQAAPAKAGELAMIASNYGIDLSRALVRRANEEAHAKGADLAVVDIPFRFKGGLRQTVDLLQLGNELPVITPMQSFLSEDRSLKSIYYQRGMGHVTPRGAATIAEMTVDWILSSTDKLSGCKVR